MKPISKMLSVLSPTEAVHKTLTEAIDSIRSGDLHNRVTSTYSRSRSIGR